MVSIVVQEELCCCHDACPCYGVCWSALTERLFAFSIWLCYNCMCSGLLAGCFNFFYQIMGDFKRYNTTGRAARFYGSWCCMKNYNTWPAGSHACIFTAAQCEK